MRRTIVVRPGSPVMTFARLTKLGQSVSGIHTQVVRHHR